MRKTIITHFFNEEYLLPWWLNHHKQYFDHGVLINYASTDRSVEIIKEICPDWTIINSRNSQFDAKLADEEVTDIESTITGWKICLNTTEFLVGDYSILDTVDTKEFIIPCCVMVDTEPTKIPSLDKSLVSQKTFGIHYNEGGTNIRRPRMIHNKNYFMYPLGRHFDREHTTEALTVLWYGWSPFNFDVIKRKLQIQTRIPATDIARGFGREHIVNEGNLIETHQKLATLSRDLSKVVLLT